MHHDELKQAKQIDRAVKYIPTFDLMAMERDLISIKPRYLQPTTSRILKELPPDEDEIHWFKEKEQDLTRWKTSRSKLRTNLNSKSDFVEFVINNRTKRLEKYMEQSCAQNLDHPSSSNRESSQTRSIKFHTFRNSVQKFESRNECHSKPKIKFISPSRTLLKSKHKKKPIDAGRVSKILNTIKQNKKKQVSQNKFTERVTKPLEDPFEWVGKKASNYFLDIIDNLNLIYQALTPTENQN